MSNIDLSRIITADTLAAEAAAGQALACKAECRARIFAVVDATAQMNLAAAAAAGGLDAGQMQAYRDGLGWIAAMRATCQGLIDNAALPADDAAWPAVPAGVAALADLF